MRLRGDLQGIKATTASRLPKQAGAHFAQTYRLQMNKILAFCVSALIGRSERAGILLAKILEVDATFPICSGVSRSNRMMSSGVQELII